MTGRHEKLTTGTREPYPIQKPMISHFEALKLKNDIRIRAKRLAEPREPSSGLYHVDPRYIEAISSLAQENAPVQHVIRNFGDQAETQLGEANAAALRGDIAEVSFIAHALAPECAFFGAHSMHELCLELHAVSGQNLDSETAKKKTISLIDALMKELEQVRAELASSIRHSNPLFSEDSESRNAESEDPKSHILLVEDSRNHRDEVLAALQPGVGVHWARSGAEGLKLARNFKFDLLLVNIVLPDFDGFELIKRLKMLPDFEETPVFFLSASKTKEDRLQGYSLGAEAYIVKPFDHDELRVRVSGALERATRKRSKEQLVNKGDLNINLTLQRASVTVGKGENVLDLTPLEFRVLCYFARNENSILSREELMTHVWGPSVYVLGRTVDKHVCTLRRKLGRCAAYLETIPRKGYRFSVLKK